MEGTGVFWEVFKRAVLAIVLASAGGSTASADAWGEFCEWRRLVGLPSVRHDPQMSAWAQMKARYRAERGLKNGHQGPKPSARWREGTGEAVDMWGWLTCCQEEDAMFGGAGLCIGHDGERYMVLVLRGGSGRTLLPRHNIPIRNTSHLTPNPPSVRSVGIHLTVRSGLFGRVVFKSVITIPAQAIAHQLCPFCGRVH